jgi:hypothetical protein
MYRIIIYSTNFKQNGITLNLLLLLFCAQSKFIGKMFLSPSYPIVPSSQESAKFEDGFVVYCMFKFRTKFSWMFLIIGFLVNFNEGGKTVYESAKIIDPKMNT